jgi:hypothetical protein
MWACKEAAIDCQVETFWCTEMGKRLLGILRRWSLPEVVIVW